MDYYSAFNIGTVCEGTIKCTYATIFNQKIAPIFSIQRRDVSFVGVKFTLDENGNPLRTVEVQEEKWDFVSSSWRTGTAFGGKNDYGQFDNLEDRTDVVLGEIIGDYPIVVCDQRVNSLWIPVHMTADAIERIRATFEGKSRNAGLGDGASKEAYINGYVVYKINENGDPNHPEKAEVKRYYGAMPEKDRNKYTYTKLPGVYHYEIVRMKLINPHFNPILTLTPNDIVYVKRKAIDWHPLNVDNAKVYINGKNMNIREAMNDAEARMRQAKRNMLLAGAGAIILN